MKPAGVVPAVVFLLLAAVVMVAYPLTEDKFQEIMRDMTVRRSGGTPTPSPEEKTRPR